MSTKTVFKANRAEVFITQCNVDPGHAFNFFFGLRNGFGLLGE